MTGLTGYLLTAGGLVVVFFAAIIKAVLWGAKREREKQAAEELKARDIADQVDNDIGALHPDAARAELNRWSR